MTASAGGCSTRRWGEGSVIEAGGAFVGPTQDHILALAEDLRVPTFTSYAHRQQHLRQERADDPLHRHGPAGPGDPSRCGSAAGPDRPDGLRDRRQRSLGPPPGGRVGPAELRRLGPGQRRQRRRPRPAAVLHPGRLRQRRPRLLPALPRLVHRSLGQRDERRHLRALLGQPRRSPGQPLRRRLPAAAPPPRPSAREPGRPQRRRAVDQAERAPRRRTHGPGDRAGRPGRGGLPAPDRPGHRLVPAAAATTGPPAAADADGRTDEVRRGLRDAVLAQGRAVWHRAGHRGRRAHLLRQLAGGRRRGRAALLRRWVDLGDLRHPSVARRRRKAVLEGLAKIVGDRALDPIEYTEHDWTRERWTQGSPVALQVPRHDRGVRPGHPPAVRSRPLGRHRDRDLLARLHGRRGPRR